MSPKEIRDDIIKALGDKSTFYSMKEWAAEFRSGREGMEDYEGSGRPIEATPDENVELVHSLIMCDRRSLYDMA